MPPACSPPAPPVPPLSFCCTSAPRPPRTPCDLPCSCPAHPVPLLSFCLAAATHPLGICPAPILHPPCFCCATATHLLCTRPAPILYPPCTRPAPTGCTLQEPRKPLPRTWISLSCPAGTTHRCRRQINLLMRQLLGRGWHPKVHPPHPQSSSTRLARCWGCTLLHSLAPTTNVGVPSPPQSFPVLLGVGLHDGRAPLATAGAMVTAAATTLRAETTTQD